MLRAIIITVMLLFSARSFSSVINSGDVIITPNFGIGYNIGFGEFENVPNPPYDTPSPGFGLAYNYGMNFDYCLTDSVALSTGLGYYHHTYEYTISDSSNVAPDITLSIDSNFISIPLSIKFFFMQEGSSTAFLNIGAMYRINLTDEYEINRSSATMTADNVFTFNFDMGGIYFASDMVGISYSAGFIYDINSPYQKDGVFKETRNMEGFFKLGLLLRI